MPPLFLSVLRLSLTITATSQPPLHIHPFPPSPLCFRARSLSCVWEGLHIIVDKTCRISPPYTADSIASCSGDKTLYAAMHAQLQKMIVRSHAKNGGGVFCSLPPSLFY